MGMDAWIDHEINGCAFADSRLRKRFYKVLQRLSQGVGRSLPLACQDWAATKAAYRFLDNPRVDEGTILAGHFQATRLRFTASKGLALVLHDTTELSFQRTDPRPIGKTHKMMVGRREDGRPTTRTVCGLLLHSSLVVTTDGVPLGLAAAKFWTRKKFKGTNALKGIDGGKHSVNTTRIPIEKKESIRWLENVRQSTAHLGAPDRCVHIGDRESDIYELFCECESLGSHFVFRTCVDRRSGDGEQTVNEAMQEQPTKAVHRVEIMDAIGRPSTAVVEIKYHRLQVCPPIGKEKRYGNLTLTVVHAQERDQPKGRDPIDWQLITNLPVTSKADAIEKLDWYAMRWKIEIFHKVLKSGCKAEESKLRTAQRLTNLLAIDCILAWRVFWLCMINRAAPKAPAALILTTTERRLLDHLASVRRRAAPKDTSHYLVAVAKLGGYLARNHDPPPGNMVLWRGLARLTDIHFGFTRGAKIVGK